MSTNKAGYMATLRCAVLYSPLLSIIRVRDEGFFDRFDGEVAAEDTVLFVCSQ